MKSLKVALVVDHFLPQIGGVEVHVGDLAKELKLRGHEAHVITSYPGPEEIQGVKVHRLKSPFFPGTNSICNPKIFKEIRSLILKEEFEVLHCHNSIFSPLAYGSVYVSQKLKLPTVLTAHSLFSIGSITFFRILNQLLRIRKWPVVITGVSHETSKRLKKAFPHHDIVTLPNGINTSEWTVERKPTKTPSIITVMRLHKKKRPQKLIEALPLLNKKLPPSDRPKVTFIGDGPMRNNLRKLAQKLRVSDQVEMLGWLPRPQIKNILAKSDLFVLPSHWESLGITALEACSAGLPVIAMAKSGARDIVVHGRHGFLSENHEDFISYMERILKDKNFGKKLGENAKVDANRFDWNKVIEKNLEMYQLAINQIS